MGEPDRAKTMKLFDEMERELKQAVDAPDPAKVSQTTAIVNVSLSLTVSRFRKLQDSADRVAQGEAICIWRSPWQSITDNKSYPKSLDALVPNYLAKLPNDLFTGEPLVYRPTEGATCSTAWAQMARTTKAADCKTIPRATTSPSACRCRSQTKK